MDPDTLCFTVYDSFRQALLTRVCPTDHGMTLDQVNMQNVYGLGEQFQTPGAADGDWIGKTRTPGSNYGNAHVAFRWRVQRKCAVSDHVYGRPEFDELRALYRHGLSAELGFHDFDLESQSVGGRFGIFRSVRFSFLGDDLPMLRENFMDLVGHPLVPPKKAFGLWVSEFGYHNWGEVDDKLTTLRAHHFPVDGFVLDVYWFGGYYPNSPTSQMGNFDWDLKNFPNPAKKVAQYWNDQGVGLMLSENSYIGQNLENFSSMANRGFLAKSGNATGGTAINSAWWGQGGMIDWTNPQAGAAWHNEHRKKLTDIGITFHWTDLGEPEMFNEDNYYAGMRWNRTSASGCSQRL